MKEHALALYTKFLKHDAARSSMIVFAGMMVINVLSYGYHLVVGRILGPAQYGELAALLSLLYILNVPAEVIRTTLIKYFSTLKAQKNLKQATFLYYWSTNRLAIVVIIGMIIALLLAPPVADFLHIETRTHIFLLYCIFGLMFFGNINIGTLLGLQRFSIAMITGNIGAFLRIVLGAIGAMFGVTWTLVANVASNMLTYLVYFIPIVRILPKKSEPMAISKRHMASYSIPVFLATFGMMIIFSQDVVWVKHYFSSFDAGIYSSLAVLGKVIFFATNAIGLVVFPMVAERKELNVSYQKLVMSALAAVGVLASGITVVYFLFPTLIVGLLFGSSYNDATAYIGMFGVFLTFFSLSSIMMNICLAAGITGIWMLTMLASFVQLIGLNLYHTSLQQVIFVNVVVSGGLLATLLVYYTNKSRQ